MGNVARMRAVRNILAAKSEGKRALGRYRSRWKDNGGKNIGWLHVCRDTDQRWSLENRVINLRVPKRLRI